MRGKCWLCGYKLSPPTVKLNNHSCHFGCADQFITAKHKTEAMLESIASKETK